MSWRLAHRGECQDSEWVQVNHRCYVCAIPIYHEKSKELASIELIKQDWYGSWVETAQADVVKVAEGYFVINPDGFYHQPPIFEKLLDPRPRCFLRRAD